jgi:NDP-sugar pyrophosphorylase family protein
MPGPLAFGTTTDRRTANAMRESPRAVVLAAGQGSRLMPLTAERPKAMLDVAGEPLLLRTLRQLDGAGFESISVVVGYRGDSIVRALRPRFPGARVIENARFAEDVNILSLLLGLGESDAPTLIVEADLAFDDQALPRVSAACNEESVWFTHGPFQPHQLGGILKTDANGRVLDLRYTPRFEPAYAGYKKLLGLLYVGPRQMPVFRRHLEAAARNSLQQYYMMPWVEQLPELACREVDLAPIPAFTFNTVEEYARCQELFPVAS